MSRVSSIFSQILQQFRAPYLKGWLKPTKVSAILVASVAGTKFGQSQTDEIARRISCINSSPESPFA